MARKYLSAFHFFFAALSSLAIVPVAAEVACVADVSYRWVKEQSGNAGSDATSLAPVASAAQEGTPPARGGDIVAAQTSPQADGAPSALATPARPGEQRVRFATIERRGADEGNVRAGLLVEINRQKSRAHERCRRDHESFGDCVSTKMSTRSSALNSLSFSARSKVEEALIEECRLQQGRCIGIESSEPTCRKLASVVEPTAATPSEASVGAGESAKSGESANPAESDGKGAGKAGEKAPDVVVDKGKPSKKK